MADRDIPRQESVFKKKLSDDFIRQNKLQAGHTEPERLLEALMDQEARNLMQRETAYRTKGETEAADACHQARTVWLPEVEQKMTERLS